MTSKKATSERKESYFYPAEHTRFRPSCFAR
jgi:hypothetical protein